MSLTGSSGPYDLIVAGGTVMLDGTGFVECDVGIRDGRFAAFLGHGESRAADEVLDATGLLVLPGVIDAHVHFGLGSPDDWETESVAAAHGGVTTVLNYIQDSRSYLDVVREQIAAGESQSIIDFCLHPILMNELHLEELDDCVEAGMLSFKYFMNFKGDEGAYMGVAGTDAGFFYDLCRKIAAHPDAVLAVHTENIEMVWRIAKHVRESGADGLPAWNASRPDLVEAVDAALAFACAEHTGARLYVPHVSSALALRTYVEHKARGGTACAETCSHYLLLTEDASAGALAKVNPPVRTALDQEVLWNAVADETISVIGSDHNSRRREKKLGTVWQASAGFPGVTILLPALLSEGFHRRGIPVEHLVKLVSRNPAEVFRIYPRKGAIRLGADADLALVDLEREQVVDGSAYGSHSDYSPYDGMKLRGWPVSTVVRGRLVMREGEITAAAGSGRLVERRERLTAS